MAFEFYSIPAGERSQGRIAANEIMRRLEEYERTGRLDELQRIPEILEGIDIPGTDAVRIALGIAKDKNLIPEKSPLRTLWYAFIKKVLLGIVRKLKNPEDTFYNTLSDLIKKSKGKLKYKDFNIENSGIVYRLAENRGFGRSPVLAVEKESLFSVFENLSKLLGIHIYASGGQASLSGTEYFYDQLPVKDLIELFTLTDFDPAGVEIDWTIKDQLNLYGNKVKHKRIGVSPEYYTAEELERSLYDVKNPEKERWNKRQYVLARKRYGIPKKKGLEIESLPASPEPIMDRLFRGVKLDSWKGQARIRLIVLKHLIDAFGLSRFFENYLRENFNKDLNATIILEKRSGLGELKDLVLDIKERLDEIVSEATESLSEDRERLLGELEKYLRDLVKEKVSDKEEVRKFREMVVKAVAEDKPKLPYKFVKAPDIDPQISQDKLSFIADNIDKLKAIAAVLERGKDWKKLFSDEYELCKIKERFKEDYEKFEDLNF